MVRQHLVAWVRNAPSANVTSMSPSKAEQQALSGKPSSAQPVSRLQFWAAVSLGVVCCLLLLTCVVLGVLHNKESKNNRSREFARLVSRYQNISDRYQTSSTDNTKLAWNSRNLTRVSTPLMGQHGPLTNTNTHLTTINTILTLERAHLQEKIHNLTNINRQLSEENSALTEYNTALREENANVSGAIDHLKRQNRNLTDLHAQILERSLNLSDAASVLSAELGEAMESNRALLDQTGVLQGETSALRESLQRASALREECEKTTRNLSLRLEVERGELREQNESLSRRIAELERERESLVKRTEQLQAEHSSLDQLCPVADHETQERHCSRCEADWTLFQGQCYLFSRDTGSWRAGRARCQARGADLLVINSEDEQRFVFAKSQSETPGGRAWMGLTDAEREGQWRWVDGSLLTQTLQYWKSRPDGGSEPDDWREGNVAGEDCGHVDAAEPELGCWMDADCDASYRWICEKSL